MQQPRARPWGNNSSHPPSSSLHLAQRFFSHLHLAEGGLIQPFNQRKGNSPRSHSPCPRQAAQHQPSTASRHSAHSVSPQITRS